jgi:FPC/CPF motif-containing protein YcgG
MPGIVMPGIVMPSRYFRGVRCAPSRPTRGIMPPMDAQTSEAAAPESSYARFADGELVLDATGEPAPALASRVHAALRALVLDPEYPCVGARSALNQGSYRFAMYDTLADPAVTDVLAGDLRRFARGLDGIDGQFASFITCFDTPKVRDEVEFEALLWRQLELLHERDDAAWDPAVSHDVSAPDFSFSFAGVAFFVVGLAPSGARWGRTFPWPVLVFNPHAQFEELRASGQFERMQEVIRERDTELEGDTNPNLANFGEYTEARQYSGREVP